MALDCWKVVSRLGPADAPGMRVHVGALSRSWEGVDTARSRLPSRIGALIPRQAARQVDDMVGVFPKLGPSRHPDHEMVTKVDQTNVANSRWTRREHASWLRGTRHVEYFETIVYSLVHSVLVSSHTNVRPFRPFDPHVLHYVQPRHDSTAAPAHHTGIKAAWRWEDVDVGGRARHALSPD
jgi:hypothetical protein